MRGVAFGLQTFGAGGSDESAATEFFFDFSLWLLVLVPTVLVIALAALKRKRTPELPQLSDLSFEIDVVESKRPVLVHVYSAWSIGDRVIEKQVERIRELHGDRFSVLWLDIDKNPGIAGAFPTLERRSVALFVGGRLVWQGVGVHEHQDLIAEIEEVLAGPASLAPPTAGLRSPASRVNPGPSAPPHREAARWPRPKPRPKS